VRSGTYGIELIPLIPLWSLLLRLRSRGPWPMGERSTGNDGQDGMFTPIGEAQWEGIVPPAPGFRPFVAVVISLGYVLSVPPRSIQK
jgi:hypothetical protein